MRQNSDTGIDRLAMSFDGNTYKSGNQLFIREKYSKDDTASFMNVVTNVIFTQMYS